jgi:hypothetical protein
MRRAAKTDANQAHIVGALIACGATVQSLAAVGRGVPDLLVGHRGRTHLFEVKDGAKVPSARKLTPDQVEWHAAWNGRPVVVVENAEQAIAALVAP